jgi:hypothetical protein
MIAPLFIGLAAGLIHVLSGPDHLSAIAPIASVQRQRVWSVGLRWGLGHSLGVVLIGLLAALLGQLVAVDPFSAGCERVVGVMLLAIGIWGFFRLGRMMSIIAPGHGHAHPAPETARGSRYAPYAIGILHGCAGSSHLIGILLALAFPTFAGVMVYLAGFVAGTLLAMTAFAAGIGWLATAGGMSSRLQRGLVGVSSLCTCAIGCYWLAA